MFVSRSKHTSPFLQSPQTSEHASQTRSLAQKLLLGTDVTVVSALSFAAVSGLLWEVGVALSANHLLGLELSGERGEIWGDLAGSGTTTSESEDEMESGLLLDVVVGKGASVLELLASEDETLLIGRDSFLILDFGSEKIGTLACYG